MVRRCREVYRRVICHILRLEVWTRDRDRPLGGVVMQRDIPDPLASVQRDWLFYVDL
jgi:hypothetical protein